MDPSPTIYNLTSVGKTDVFIQKIDTNGNFIWANSFGGVLGDIGHSINTDVSGNVYITGSFEGTVDFESGEENSNLISSGQLDVFVLKMNQNTLGINELINNTKVTIFPNPSVDKVNIEFNQSINNVKLILTDVQGKIFLEERYGILTDTTIKLPEAKGIYFLTLQTSNNNSTIKLLKD
ncbi:T9SS type A sorting domain-containing protein [Aquimarina latercula]|uniref:T9SS type A sorting domain-containing protein n=1 Tax=Aquimarina latercula TaxID=987 RepID=UPI00040A7B4D|nr:T9SS type A sorting domain-containing protein [Aquimarina latercula]